jgi:hypothetical protein
MKSFTIKIFLGDGVNMKIIWKSLILFWLLPFMITALYAQGEPGAGAKGSENTLEWVTFKSPEENQTIIGKKIRIEAQFNTPIKTESLVLLLDNVDITQIAEITKEGFTYEPFMVLASGNHTLSMVSVDTQERALQKSLSFSIRHSEKFEELYSKNEVSAVYEVAVKKAEGANDLPSSKIEGGLTSESRMKNESWDVSFKTNIRYFDQDTPVNSPQQIGIYPASYLLSAKYQREALKFGTDIGDLLINESFYTAQSLARRGGSINLGYKDFDFRTFSVLSQQVIGFNGGLGIQTTTDDHIQGVSSGVRLFNKRMEVRGVYVQGGESGSTPVISTPFSIGTQTTSPPVTGNPLGIGPTAATTPVTDSPLGMATTTGKRKSEAIAFLVNTDFFQGLLKGDAELSLSRFDADTADTIGAQDDQAYRVRLGGTSGRYSYEALYEYIGKDYEVVGNPMIQKDRKGMALKGGANFDIQSFTASLSRYTDNVQEDPLLPRLQIYQGGIDYSFTKFQKMPLGFGYRKTLQDTLNEPVDSNPSKMDTDTIYGRISYQMGFWNLGFLTNFSRQDDRSSANNDSTAISYTLSPTYNNGKFSILPSLSLIQTDNLLTNARTDNYLISLQAMGKTYYNRITYELGSSYSVLKATDNSVDTKSLSGTFRVGYSLAKYFLQLFNPSIALKCVYNNIIDQVNPSAGKDDFSVFLVFSSTFPFSF